MSDVIEQTLPADAPLPDEPQAPADAATAEQTQPEAAAPSETEEQKNARVKSGVEKRIGELTYKVNQAQRERQAEAQARADVEARYIEAQTRLQQYETYATAPRIDQYETVEQWQAATMQHANQNAQQQIQRTLMQAGMHPAQQQERAQQQHLAAVIENRVAEASTKYPDFSEKVMDPQLPTLGNLNPAVRDALLMAPNFADLVYHLANNPREAWRLAQTHPAQAIMELGTMSSRLNTAPRVSNAPNPPRELGSSEVVSKDPTKMSMGEYRAWRKTQR